MIHKGNCIRPVKVNCEFIITFFQDLMRRLFNFFIISSDFIISFHNWQDTWMHTDCSRRIWRIWIKCANECTCKLTTSFLKKQFQNICYLNTIWYIRIHYLKSKFYSSPSHRQKKIMKISRSEHNIALTPHGWGSSPGAHNYVNQWCLGSLVSCISSFCKLKTHIMFSQRLEYLCNYSPFTIRKRW